MENSPDKMSILLQFAKFSKGYRISDFEEFVQESIGVENMDFFGRLAYPNQWQIRLTDPDLRERLIRMGRTRIKNRSCWMYPLNPQEIRGFVHWLPNSVTNDQLREHLQLYGEVLFVESQERIIRGSKIESDPRYYGLILPHGTVKEDLPHFLKINGFLSLVIVRGREPACYHCKEVGHFRAECPKYKSKLISYCNRVPNTAPPRLRPRGRRHINAEAEVRTELDRNEVSSSDDIVRFEKEVSVPELITEPHLSPSEDQEQGSEAQEGTIVYIGKELVESDILAQRKVKSCIGSSVASFSESQSKDILETMQEIQQKAKKDLQQKLQNFEMEIAQAITRGVFSTHTIDQRRSTSTEATCENLEHEIRNELEMQAKEVYSSEEIITTAGMAENNSISHTDIKESKGTNIRSGLQITHQVKVGTVETDEQIYKESEENLEYLPSTESTTKVSTSHEDDIFLILKETKHDASEIFKSLFKKLEKLTSEIRAHGKPSSDSAAVTKSKLSEEDLHDLLSMLEKAKSITTVYCEETVKKMEANLYSQMNRGIDTAEKLTEDDIRFAKQRLEKIKENAREIFQNTFRNLENEVVKLVEQCQTTIESSDKNKPKIKNVATEPHATLEQLKQDIIDTVKHICNEDLEVAVRTENSEKASSHDRSLGETIQSDPVTVAQRDLEANEIYKCSKESGKVTPIEKAFPEKTAMELTISKATQEDINQLQMNLKKIFALVQDKSELFPETKTVLKQVESDVSEIVEETKKRCEKNIEDIFASY